jgi:hypothetical protein
MKRKLIILIFIASLGLVSCQRNYAAQRSIEQEKRFWVPLVNQPEGTVWLLNAGVENGNVEIVAHYPLYYPLASLTTDELAILEHNYCANNHDLCQNISPTYTISELTLSPDQEHIAWKESVLCAPTQNVMDLSVLLC